MTSIAIPQSFLTAIELEQRWVHSPVLGAKAEVEEAPYTAAAAAKIILREKIMFVVVLE